MNTFETVFILSAEKPEYDSYLNHDRNCQLGNDLNALGLPYTGISEVVNGFKRQSFLVVTTKKKAVLELAKKYGTETVLFSDASRKSQELAVNSKDKKELGILRQITREAAKNYSTHYIVCEDGKTRYFTAL